MEIKEEDLEKFRNNLKKVSNFTEEAIVETMEVAQGLVINEARKDHPYIKKGIPNPPGHPSERYYTHTSRLTNSIRSGEVKATKDEIVGEIYAGEGSLTPYAAYVESLYPYLEPALEEMKNEILQLFAKAVEGVLKG